MIQLSYNFDTTLCFYIVRKLHARGRSEKREAARGASRGWAVPGPAVSIHKKQKGEYTMKKRAFFLIAAIFCLALAACDASDPEDLFQSGSVPPPAEEPEGPAVVVTQDEGYYQYGNMQIDCSGNYILYDGQILFTRDTEKGVLAFTYDMTTEEVSLLCKDATCSHRREDCPAKIEGCLEQYDGRLYATIIRNWSSFGKDPIFLLVEYKNGKFEPILDGSIEGFCHGNGNLYVKTADQTLIVYENGSDTPRTLMDEYQEANNVVFGQYLYSTFSRGVCRVDLLAEEPQLEVLIEDAYDAMVDGEHIYYYMDRDEILYRCDMDGTNSMPLTDRPVAGINFDDKYFYFRYRDPENPYYGEESGDLYRLDKKDPTKLEKIAELPEAIHRVYTVPGYDLLFIRTRSRETDELGNFQEGPLFTMTTDGEEITELVIPEY